jgi:hypothetical protein
VRAKSVTRKTPPVQQRVVPAVWILSFSRQESRGNGACVFGPGGQRHLSGSRSSSSTLGSWFEQADCFCRPSLVAATGHRGGLGKKLANQTVANHQISFSCLCCISFPDGEVDQQNRHQELRDVLGLLVSFLVSETECERTFAVERKQFDHRPRLSSEMRFVAARD